MEPGEDVVSVAPSAAAWLRRADQAIRRFFGIFGPGGPSAPGAARKQASTPCCVWYGRAMFCLYLPEPFPHPGCTAQEVHKAQRVLDQNPSPERACGSADDMCSAPHRSDVMRTVVAIFESPLKANEAVHILLQARFSAERLPRISRDSAQARSSLVRRMLGTIAGRVHRFIDVDTSLQPYASALASGRFVVKVRAVQDPEVVAAKRILELAGSKEIDVLAGAWVDS